MKNTLYLKSLRLLISISFSFGFLLLGHSQSTIQGKVYFIDTLGITMPYTVEIFDSISTLRMEDLEISRSIDGSFIINNVQGENISMWFWYPGYRKTIVENIMLDADTVKLDFIPLVIDDEVWYENQTIVTKHCWGLFSTERTLSVTHGTEGPYSNKNEVYLYCNNHQDSVLFKIDWKSIIVDYNNIKRCGNTR